jgi:hypothetical protein
MAHAKRNTLRRSTIEAERQQRQEQAVVPGASGGPPDTSPRTAEVTARRRRGKTNKNVREDRVDGE